jgi:phospholipase A1
MIKKIVLLAAFTLFAFASDSNKFETIDIHKIKSDKSRDNMQKWLNGNFALETYKVNYILPYGYSTRTYASHAPSVQYENIEAELQVSLKLKVGEDLLGLNESYYVSYSHQSFWQIYVQSAPFRETNYNPEAFMIIPINDENSIFELRSLKLAIAHKSNGQPNTSDVVFSDGKPLGNLSRSINYVYATIRTQYDTLIADVSIWGPLGVTENLSDNPDLMDYIGYSSLKFTYFYNDHMFTLMGRGNIETHKGAVVATYSYPIHDNTNLYVKIFSGYEESLIDYNHNLTKFSIGFSFSR